MSELFTLNNGNRLHLDEFGPSGAESTTLVALHGLGGAGYLFAGIGQSEPTPSTRFEEIPPVDELKGRPIGRVLTKMNKVTREQVVEALELQKKKPALLGQMLVALGYVEQADINVALSAQRGQALARPTSIRALCPDLPGNGLSPRPKQPITFDYFTDVIVQLIKHKTTGPIALLGHSMGAIIALKVYAALPDCINSLIFVGGLPAPLPQAQSRLRERAALIRATGLASVTPTIIPVLFAERSFNTIPDKIAMFTRLLAQSDGEGYAQTADALANASAADIAPRVRIPCLCITGAQDRYAPPNAVRAFADSISGAGYREIPNCGHMPFYETPEEFNGMIRSFLAEAE